MVLHLRGAIGLEHRKRATLAAELTCHGLSHLDAASHSHKVDIGRRPVEDYVAHIAAHHIALAAKLIGRRSNKVEHLTVHVSLYVFVAVIHDLSLRGANLLQVGRMDKSGNAQVGVCKKSNGAWPTGNVVSLLSAKRCVVFCPKCHYKCSYWHYRMSAIKPASDLCIKHAVSVRRTGSIPSFHLTALIGEKP